MLRKGISTVKSSLLRTEANRDVLRFRNPSGFRQKAPYGRSTKAIRARN